MSPSREDEPRGTNGDGLRFRSKVDLWLVLLSVAPCFLLVYPAIREASQGTVWVPLVILLPVGAFVWMLRSTVYVVSGTTLTARCMGSTRRIPLQSITALRASRDPLSAPALSLDRIGVLHGGGTLLVSPADRAGFVQAILVSAPAISVEGLRQNVAG